MPSHVLIIEDEANIVESLSFLLKRDGFAVDTVPDGAEALAAIARLTPDMVILDIMLPNLSGFDILRDIREQAAFQDLPVLMLTAKGQSKDKERAQGLGVDVFMTKPFSNAELVAKVHELVDRQALSASSGKE